MACKRCGLPLDPLSGDVDRHPIGSCVVQLMGEVDQLRSQVEKLHGILKDPAAVALNMKRGFIARPSDLHWETENETTLRHENEDLRAVNERLRLALRVYADKGAWLYHSSLALPYGVWGMAGVELGEDPWQPAAEALGA